MTAPLYQERLARLWLLVLGAARTATYPTTTDARLLGYAQGRYDGLRTGYATAAGLSDEAVRDRVRIELDR